MKKLIIVVAVFILAFFCLYAFSPYTHSPLYSGEAIVNSVEINAPAEDVFSYLGNSANASQWSVFVKKITPLNAHEVPDGKPGSIRRCFTELDESAMVWDEEIVLVEPNVKRTLTTFNFKNFPITVHGLATDQLYETPREGKTRLTFTVYFKNPPTLWERVKLNFTAYYISNVFDRNLANIKRFVEAG